MNPVVRGRRYAGPFKQARSAPVDRFSPAAAGFSSKLPATRFCATPRGALRPSPSILGPTPTRPSRRTRPVGRYLEFRVRRPPPASPDTVPMQPRPSARRIKTPCFAAREHVRLCPLATAGTGSPSQNRAGHPFWQTLCDCLIAAFHHYPVRMMEGCLALAAVRVFASASNSKEGDCGQKENLEEFHGRFPVVCRFRVAFASQVPSETQDHHHSKRYIRLTFVTIP